MSQYISLRRMDFGLNQMEIGATAISGCSGWRYVVTVTRYLSSTLYVCGPYDSFGLSFFLSFSFSVQCKRGRLTQCQKANSRHFEHLRIIEQADRQQLVLWFICIFLFVIALSHTRLETGTQRERKRELTFIFLLSTTVFAINPSDSCLGCYICLASLLSLSFSIYTI